MTTPPVSVSVEQLLVPFGNLFVNLHIRLFEPAEARGTVVCFHGFCGNGADFDMVARALALSGHRVVCPDLVGRGASGQFEDTRNYNLNNTVSAAAAVLDKYGGGGCSVVAMGWGAVIALVLLSSVRATVPRLLLCDVPLRFVPLEDPVLARAVADVGMVFETRGEALQHVLASPEFTALEPRDPELLAHRVRRVDEGFRQNHHDGIVARLSDFAGRRFDIGLLLREFDGNGLLLFGPALEDDAAAAVEALRGSGAGIACIDAITPRGPLLLRELRELLIVIGFLDSRLPAWNLERPAQPT